jgi:uroporphyrinogen-III synthase
MRVIVTRAAGQAAPLVDALRDAGFEAVACPLIEIEPIDDGPIDVRGYDWVIVTSAHGADELARRRVGMPARIAAVGLSTAAALEERGLQVDFVPSVQTQDGLVTELPRPVGRALFVGAEAARGLIVSELGADFRAAYRTRELRPEPPPEGDLGVLSSPSAARAFAALGRDVPVVAIGPQTERAARSVGLRVAAVARRPSVEGVVEAVREAAAG